MTLLIKPRGCNGPAKCPDDTPRGERRRINRELQPDDEERSVIWTIKYNLWQSAWAPSLAGAVSREQRRLCRASGGVVTQTPSNVTHPVVTLS